MEGNEQRQVVGTYRVPYISCIKLFGCPILPPFIDTAKRLEMQRFKEQAIAVERLLEDKRLESAAQDKRISFDSGVPESLLASYSELSEACYSLSTGLLQKSTAEMSSSFPKPALSTINSTRQASEENIDNSLIYTQVYQSFPLLSDSQHSIENTIENQLNFDSNIDEQYRTDVNDKSPYTHAYESNQVKLASPLVDEKKSSFEDGLLKHVTDLEFITSANTTGSTDLNQYLDLTVSSIESPIRGTVRQQDFSLSGLSFDASSSNRVPNLSATAERDQLVAPEYFLKSPNVALLSSPIYRNTNLSTSLATNTDDNSSIQQILGATHKMETIDDSVQQVDYPLDENTAKKSHVSVTSVLESFSKFLEKEIDHLQPSRDDCSVPQHTNEKDYNMSTEIVDNLPALECLGTNSVESLSVPLFVRQNSYTLLEGPSPLILAHMEKNKPENVNHPLPQSCNSQDSFKSPQSLSDSQYKSSKTLSRSGYRSANDSPPQGSRSNRKGWDLDHAKEFWSSTDALNQFAVPKVPNRKPIMKSSSFSSVPSKLYRNKSLPNSASVSPVKYPLRNSAFGSVDCIRSKTVTPSKQPTRRSLFTGPPSKSVPSSISRRSSSSAASLTPKQNNHSVECAHSTREKGSPKQKAIARSVGKPEKIHSLKKVPGSLDLTAGEKKSSTNLNPSTEPCDASYSVSDVIQRLQNEHEKQMALLLEKQQADQEKMRQDFKIQEEKLLTDVIKNFPELKRHFLETHPHLIGDENTEIAITNVKSAANPSSNPLDSVNLMDDVASGVSLICQNCSHEKMPVTESFRRDNQLTILPDQLNPSVYETYEELTLSQRNNYNAMQIGIASFDEMVSSQKENICDTYANSEVNSFVKSPRGPADTFRQLHQNGQTLPAKPERENEVSNAYDSFSPSVHSTTRRSRQSSTVTVCQRQSAMSGDTLRSESELSSECTINLSSDFTESRLSTPNWRARLSASNETMIQERRPAYSALEQVAATTIVSAAKGYLVRRLMKTNYVQNIIRTISDVTLAAVELHHENAAVLNATDVELSRRLIHQLNSSWLLFYDTFFALTCAERIMIIANDRSNLLQRQERPKSVRGRLSLATQRSMRRKQNKSSDDTSPVENRRSSIGSISSHRPRSVHSRYSVMSASADSANSRCSATSGDFSVKTSSRAEKSAKPAKPWR